MKSIRDMPAYEQMTQTGDAVPLALVDEAASPHAGLAVRSGLLCLVHERWDFLAWDGFTVRPMCCIAAPMPVSLHSPTAYALNPADWEKLDLAEDNKTRYYFRKPVT